MGSCTSCNNKQKKSYDKYQQLEIMLDPAEQISFDKSVRKFKVQFQKIKVKNVPSVNSYVHVNFDNQHAFETPLQKNQNFNGAWKINHEFVYEISDERLKKEAYVLFIIKDKQGIDLGKVKISLQLIATGPYHHDIQIHWKQVSPELKKQDEDLKDVGSFPGRLQFDLKMSQEIKFEILPKSLTCKMYEGLKEKAYNFSLKVITPLNHYTSNHSDNFLNPAQNVNLYLESPSPSRISTRKIIQKLAAETPEQKSKTPDVAETYKLTQQYNSLQRQSLIQQSSTQSGIKQNSTGQISLEKYFKYQDDGVKHPLSHFKPVSGNGNSKNEENQQDGLMTKNIDLKFIDKIGHSNNNQTNNTNGGIVNANINNLNVSGELQNQLKKAEADNKKVSQNQIDNINQYVHDNTDIQQIRKSVFDIEQQQFLAEEEFDPNLMEEKRRRIKPEGKTSLFNNIINNDIFYYDDNQQQKMMSEKNMISWEYLGLASEQIPDILMELYSKDISNTTIQIQIWGVQPNQQVLDYIANNQEDTQNQIQMPLFEMSIVGECYIGLTKFLITQPEYKLNNKGEIISERRNHFSEVLRKDGIAVGQIEGDFIIINNHFLKQMVLGVMTQDGIRKNSSAIYQPVISDPKQQFDPVDELTQAKDQLLDVVFKHQKKIGMEKIRLKRDIKKNIQIIQDLLSQKHKQSVHSFYYKNREELYKSQSLLIELANHLYEYADEDDQVYLKPLYYDCLKLIMNRGEFNLETIGFSDEFKIFIDRNFNVKNMNKKQKELYKIFKKKLKIGLEYQQLMYHTLDICLKKMNIKALIEQERQFIENFLALAYFKITKYREKILEIIIRKDDESKIPEWRGTERQLEDSGHLYKSLQKQNQTQLNQHTKYFQSFFDWDQGFYQYMLSTLEGDANEQQLISIINQEEWQKKIGKRGIAFFFFLNEWAKYVSNTVIVNEQLPWYDLPGYKQIIKAFLLEMKSRDLDKYPDALKNASVSLLHNEKLLNIMVQLVYKKTSLYDSSRVIKTLDIINIWFQSLYSNKKTIPTLFDYNFFLKGLLIILNDTHSFAMTQALWLLYNNFPLFPLEFKKELCNCLLGHLFYKLFMHWSKSLRNVFHYLLVYRIFHLHQNVLTEVGTLEDLEARMTVHNNSKEAYDNKYHLTSDIKNKYLNDYINKHFARTQDTIEKLHFLYSEKKKKEMQRLKKFHKTKSNLQTLKEQLQKRKEQNQYLAEAQKLLNQQKLGRFKSNFVKSAQKVKRKGLLEQAIEQCQPEYDYKVQQPNTDESSLLENASQILNTSSISRNLASKYRMSVKGNALNNQKIDNIDKMHPHTTSVIKDYDEPDLEKQDASDPLEVQQLRRYSNPNQDLQMIQLKNKPDQQQNNSETEFISGELKLKKKNSSLNDQEHDSRVDFLNNLNNLNNFNGFNSLKTVENEPNPNNNYHNIQENNKQFNHVKNFIMPERYQSVNQRPTYLDKNNNRENLINSIQQNKLLQTNMTASRERQKTSQLVQNNHPSQYNKQLYNNSPQIGDMFQYSRKFSHQEFTPVKFKEFSAEQQTTMLKKNFLKENPFLIKKNAGYIDAKKEPQIREMTIQQIESQYIKYLDDSMQEYKKVKETYLSWYAQNLNLISHLPPNTQKKIMMELMVPDIKIQQSMDEGERNISDNWTTD